MITVAIYTKSGPKVLTSHDNFFLRGDGKLLEVYSLVDEEPQIFKEHEFQVLKVDFRTLKPAAVEPHENNLPNSN